MQPGTRLGPYEIVSPLGAGGMGEVWRAKVTRLARDAAMNAHTFQKDPIMSLRILAPAALACGVALAGQAPPPASPVPVAHTSQMKRVLTPEDVADIRKVFDANLSPDGKRIAFVVREPGDPNRPQAQRARHIWVVPVDGGQQAKLFATSDKSDTAPRWSPDGHWLAFLSDRGADGRKQIWRLSADGGEAEKLTSAKTGVNGFKWSPSGRMLAFMTRDERTEEERRRKESWNDAIHVDQKEHYRRLWVIDLNDRSTTLITKNDIEINDFDWSPDGSSFAIAFSAVPGFLKDFDLSLGVVRRTDGAVVRKLADNVNLFWNSNVRWSPDGKTLLYFEAAPSRVGSWLSLIDSGGGVVRPLLKNYPGTFWSADWAADSRHVVAEFLSGSQAKLVRIDIGTGKIESLADILNGDADFSASSDGRTFAFVSERTDSPGEIWASVAGMQPRQLTHLNRDIESVRLGDVRDISWASQRDGEALHGVLVTPPDFKSGKPYPTVVETHEGNSAWISGWQGSWYQWAQLLASNGYVVFLPNVRGVTGQGWKFSEFIHTYEGEAFADTMDGVDFLIAQKVADPARLGIGGWSNGGFMTAWAITHTHRFKAAVPFAAPVDLPVWWGASSLGRLLELTFGDAPLGSRKRYEADSPLYFVQNCSTPTLVMHGEDDPIVPVGQAYEFYRALKTLGVQTEMVVYPREGHGIDERAHQIDF